MAPASYSASAPGSLMLLGEHAVLRGRRALACAVNKRIRTTLTPRDDTKITIRSGLGDYASSLTNLEPEERFQFILAAVRRYASALPSGFELQIDSDFSHMVGLGSSAAVTLAAVAVFRRWLGQPVDAGAVFDEAFNVVRSVQGAGSGTDLAAGAFGGTVAYRMDPREISPLDKVYPITVVYCGHKEPTVKVVKQVNEAADFEPQRYDELFNRMDESVEQAMAAIEVEDWKRVGEIMDSNQEHMDALGVNTPGLQAIVEALREDCEIRGAKISGSGLGDCVVALGEADAGSGSLPGEVLNVQMSTTGLDVG